MPTRSKSQSIGTLAENLVQSVVDQNQNWFSRRQERDFGVDLEVEFAPQTSKINQILTGKFLKLQVKGSSTLKRKKHNICVRVERKLLKYAEQFRVPFVLVAVDTTKGEAFFIWLQQWLLVNENNYLNSSAKTLVVEIPCSQTLASGLNMSLKSIALGHDETAILLGLRELANTSMNTSLISVRNGILDLLAKEYPERLEWLFEKPLDSLINLGPNIGLWKTQEFEEKIVAVVDRLRGRLNIEQIERLVIRDASYSRTGVNVLGMIYNKWSLELTKLRLPDHFRRIGHEEIAWYCDFREQNDNSSSIDLYFSLSSKKPVNTQFGKLMLTTNQNVRDELFVKWPNRGDWHYLELLVGADRVKSN